MPQIGGMIMDRLVTVFQNSAMYQLTYTELQISPCDSFRRLDEIHPYGLFK